MVQKNRTPKREREALHASYSHGVQVANNISNLAMAAIAAGQQANNNLAATMQVATAQAAQSSQALLAMSLASVQASVLHQVQGPPPSESTDEDFDPETAQSLGLATLPPRPSQLHVGGDGMSRRREERVDDHCGDDGRSHRLGERVDDHCGEDRRSHPRGDIGRNIHFSGRSHPREDVRFSHRPQTPPRKINRRQTKTPPRKDDRQPNPRRPSPGEPPRRAADPSTARRQSPGERHPAANSNTPRRQSPGEPPHRAADPSAPCRQSPGERHQAANSNTPCRQSPGVLEDGYDYYSDDVASPREAPEEVPAVTADRYGGRSSSRVIVSKRKAKKDKKERKEEKRAKKEKRQ